MVSERRRDGEVPGSQTRLHESWSREHSTKTAPGRQNEAWDGVGIRVTSGAEQSLMAMVLCKGDSIMNSIITNWIPPACSLYDVTIRPWQRVSWFHWPAAGPARQTLGAVLHMTSG